MPVYFVPYMEITVPENSLLPLPLLIQDSLHYLRGHALAEGIWSLRCYGIRLQKSELLYSVHTGFRVFQYSTSCNNRRTRTHKLYRAPSAGSIPVRLASALVLCHLQHYFVIQICLSPCFIGVKGICVVVEPGHRVHVRDVNLTDALGNEVRCCQQSHTVCFHVISMAEDHIHCVLQFALIILFERVIIHWVGLGPLVPHISFIVCGERGLSVGAAIHDLSIQQTGIRQPGKRYLKYTLNVSAPCKHHYIKNVVFRLLTIDVPGRGFE